MQVGTSTFNDTKAHYEILDGLRGVAAIMVVFFHLLEVFSNGDHTKQMINHGYLAVDFFFLLSGFVIAHAYDDRWHKMTVKQFIKRRLIRLHPMIIFGMTVGALCFYFSASEAFPLVAQTPVWKLLIFMLLGYILFPVTIPMDIRGWQEMYPLNGPAWSLFFEYIANLLYVLIFRRLSKTVLAILVAIAAIVLVRYAVTAPNGDIIGGWSINAEQLNIGFTRLLYPFMAGILLSRIFKPINLKNAFLICSLMVVAVLSFPRVGGKELLWANGLFDAFTVIFIFPIIVFLGASGKITNALSHKVCTFFGNISYPLYIVHFPFTYVYYAWISNNKLTLAEAWPGALLVLAASVFTAHFAFKFYDVPVRKWLTKKFS